MSEWITGLTLGNLAKVGFFGSSLAIRDGINRVTLINCINAPLFVDQGSFCPFSLTIKNKSFK